MSNHTNVRAVVQLPDGTWKAITTDCSSRGLSATRVIILADTIKTRRIVSPLVIHHDDWLDRIKVLKDNRLIKPGAIE